MTIADTGAVTRAVDLVETFFGSALDCLAGWNSALVRDLEEADDGALTVSRLDDIVRPYAAITLSEPRIPVYGAGFVAASDLLAGVRQHLSWWQGPGHDKLTLASRGFNKEHLDYSEFEWYRVPMETGEPHVAGPSVDYLCCDEYTMTASMPVKIDDHFVGIIGLDLLVDHVERELTPLLRQEPGPITLVNDLDRVVISTDIDLETGASMFRRKLPKKTRRRRCGSLPLTLLVG